MADHSLFPVLDKFQDLQWTSTDGSEGECLCPAHDDGEKKGKRSLHIKIKPDEVSGRPKILLHCHAGCSSGQIVAALGVGYSSLFPANNRHEQHPHTSGNVMHPPAKPSQAANRAPQSPDGKPTSKFTKTYDKPVACYSYRDQNGEVLHQTLRYEPKRFAQRRRAEPKTTYTFGTKQYKSFTDENGHSWIYTLKGIEPVVFNLPAILRASKDRPIFLCEGEKDAIRLIKLGFLATTVPMGSGKWRASYTETFRGRHVYIFPDFDKPRLGQDDPAANPGFDGARKIARELVGVAAAVRIVYLPNPDGKLIPKWDVSDWIDTQLASCKSEQEIKDQIVQTCQESELLTAGHPGLNPAGRTSSESPNSSITAELITDPALQHPQVSGTTLPVTTSIATATDPASSTITTISNFMQTADDKYIARSVEDIENQIFTKTGGWPKRIGGELFFVYPESNTPTSYRVQWISKTPSLFAWLGNQVHAPIQFAKVPFGVSKDELFANLQDKAEEFKMIERYPHYPPAPGVYYACRPESEWKSRNPGCLATLVSMFSPESHSDGQLILAMILTLFWGGPGGRRPLFVITSDSGRGSGKTTFAEIVTSLVDGAIQISSNADDDVIRQRLLSPEGMEKRAILMDNVKTNKFSWAEMEALITSDAISGKRMYVGEGSRPNRITYIVTINGPSFSTDLAQRSITIKLRKPEHSGTWQQEIYQYIADNKESLIAEALEYLRAPSEKMTNFSRWGQWEQEVLSKVSGAKACQELVRMRQEELDAEKEESTTIEEQFARQLDRNRINPSLSRVFICNETAGEWLNKALGEKNGKVQACRILTRLINEGRIKRITKAAYPERLDASPRKERGFWWQGELWDENKESKKPTGLETFEFKDDEWNL